MPKPLMGVVVLAGFAALTAVVPAAAQAYPHRPTAPQQFTCTGQDWAGHALRPVTLEVPGTQYDAAHRAQVEWRGQAKFATITCTPN